MSSLKPAYGDELKYNHIIGTGGVGSGLLFSLQGNQTLGRNESRMATLQPYKDFCKQHIILHYIAVLLQGSRSEKFKLYPIGKVGNDEIGRQLILQMQHVGMDIANVEICKENGTLFSVCFQYPDGSGGNITSENSASSRVYPADITRFFKQYQLDGKKGIILSVPEVPVVSRIELLKYGKKNGSLNVASLLSSEVDEFTHWGGFNLTDILAINIDEARSIAQITDDTFPISEVIETCIEKIVKINPESTILITEGANGSYCYVNNNIEFTSVLKTEAVSTAGAGDAFLAGVICGICCGLPLHKGQSSFVFSQFPLQTAVELGTLLASLSVKSADTIHAEIDAKLLSEYARQKRLDMTTNFNRIFRNSF